MFAPAYTMRTPTNRQGLGGGTSWNMTETPAGCIAVSFRNLGHKWPWFQAQTFRLKPRNEMTFHGFIEKTAKSGSKPTS